MSDWIKTKAGLQMADTITRQLPKIMDALQEIAIGLNYLRRLENEHRRHEDEFPIVTKGKNNGSVQGE